MKDGLSIISSVFFLLLTLQSANAIPDAITKIPMAYSVSLGNDMCIPNECDNYALYFLIPQDKDSETVPLTIIPSCFVHSFAPNETDLLYINCLDGSNYTYDIKNFIQSGCLISDYLDFDVIIEGSGGIVSLGEQTYNQFWCSFRRDPNNLNAIPTEFTVYIHGIGLHSKYLVKNETQNFESMSGFATSIQSFTELNISVWRVIFALFVVGAIFLGMFFIVGALPSAIKWVIRKMTED
jgi:hypothetical protein